MVKAVKINDPANQKIALPSHSSIDERERQRLARQHHEWLSYIVGHATGGMILGALVVVALLYFDVNRIATMVFNTSSPGLFILLMVAGFGSTFGMVATGTAIYFKSTESKD